MPVARREAEVLWEGPLASGTGTLKSGSSALDEVDGAPRITSVELSVRARVPGLDAGKFEQIVGRAGDLCPVSNALRGNVEISIRHELQLG